MEVCIVCGQVCEEAKCPNIGECWGGQSGTATATIMVSFCRRDVLRITIGDFYCTILLELLRGEYG